MGAEALVAALVVSQVASAYTGYKAQKDAASATRRANEAAAAQAAKEAEIAKEDAKFNAKKEAQDARRARSAQLVQYLKSGVSLQGSPLLVADSTLEQGKENQAIILKNADARAESIVLGGKAAQQPVQKADFFGAVAKGAGALNSAGYLKSSPAPSSNSKAGLPSYTYKD